MSEASTNSSSTQNVSTIISGLLSNPESLSKISEIISKYTSSENGSNSPLDAQNMEDSEEEINDIDKNHSDSHSDNPTEQVFKNGDFPFDFTKIVSLFGSGIDGQKPQNKEQIALLLASRPYLSPRRKELIDSFVKFSRLGAFLTTINENGGQNVLQ